MFYALAEPCMYEDAADQLSDEASIECVKDSFINNIIVKVKGMSIFPFNFRASCCLWGQFLPTDAANSDCTDHWEVERLHVPQSCSQTGNKADYFSSISSITSFSSGENDVHHQDR